MIKGMKKTLNENKGFSLVEVLVVITIMMILVGMAAITYQVISNANVSKAAKALNSDFATARTTCMAKGVDEGTLTLKIINGRMYSYIGSAAEGAAATASEMKQISNGATDVMFATSPDAIGGAVLAEGYSVQYSFTPSGALTTGTADACYVYLFANKKRGARAFFYPETGRHDTNIYVF